MKVLFYILLAFATPFILLLLGAVGYAFYLIATGKDKTPEVQAKIADLKKRKAEKKANKIAHSESFPIDPSSNFLPSWWDD